MTVPSNVEWTLQSAFLYSVEHLTQMKHASTSDNKSSIPSYLGSSLYNGCAYRAPDGGSCAVGCLIPDDQYNPSLETKICTAKEITSLPCFKNIGATDWYILRDLQIIHDTIANWDDKGLTAIGRQKIFNLAQAHNLTLSENFSLHA